MFKTWKLSKDQNLSPYKQKNKSMTNEFIFSLSLINGRKIANCKSKKHEFNNDKLMENQTKMFTTYIKKLKNQWFNKKSLNFG
jgi:hypothetical protein